MLFVIMPKLWHLLKENWTGALCRFTETFCPCSPPSEGPFIKTSTQAPITQTQIYGILFLFVRIFPNPLQSWLKAAQILECALKESWLSQIYLLQFHLWHEPCCVINLTTLINYKHGDMYVIEVLAHNLFPHIAAQAERLSSSKHARNKNNNNNKKPPGLFCLSSQSKRTFLWLMIYITVVLCGLTGLVPVARLPRKQILY